MSTQTQDRIMSNIQTQDLYYAAYLMANGGKLEDVSVVREGKRKIVFEFRGPDLIKRAHEYVSGEGVVNIRFLKSALEHLKGIIFEKLH